MKLSFALPVLALGVLVQISGCGDAVSDRPDLIPVSGTVMYSGKPVVGATVSFFGPEAPRAAQGVTDDAGKFTLSMFEANDGCLAGDNVITVTKIEGSAAPAASNDVMTPPDPLKLSQMGQDMSKKKADDGPKYIVPKKYSDQNTTPLKETIAPNNPPIMLQLAD